VPFKGTHEKIVDCVFAPVRRISRPVFRKVAMKMARKTADVSADTVW